MRTCRLTTAQALVQFLARQNVERDGVERRFFAGGLGAKIAAPDREVYVMVGDGSWLMMSSELATSIQEHVKLTVILVDNHGFGSIRALSESVGSGGFGTQARYRGEDGLVSGGHLPIDLMANAASLGAETIEVSDIAQLLKEALKQSKRNQTTTVIKIEADPEVRVGRYDTWWDVPVAEVLSIESVATARAEYEDSRESQSRYL